MEKLTADTYRVQFALPGNSRLGLWPGQHLVLRYTQVVGGSMLPSPALPFAGCVVWATAQPPTSHLQNRCSNT